MATPAPARRRKGLAYLLPLFLVLIGGPATIYSMYRSAEWIGAPFPGFLVMENRVVPSVGAYDWPARTADLFHAQVLTVDGAPVNSAADVYQSAAQHAPGTTFEYTLRRGEREFRVRIPTQIFTTADFLQVYGILLLVGCMNLILGAVVGLLRPANRQARAYVVLSFVGCLFATTSIFLHQPGFPLLTRVYLLAESFFPAAFFHFALCFPVDRLGRIKDVRRRRAWIVAPYVIAAGLSVAKLYGFSRDPPDLSAFYVTYVYIAASFVTFFVLLIVALRRESEPEVHLRIRTLVPSVTVGTALCVFAFLDNALAGGSFPMQLGLLIVPIFFASIAYAIVAHDLFGIDRFVRWTFVYAVLSVVVFVAYTLLASAVPALAQRSGGGVLLFGGGFVLLALVLDPLRRFVQRGVDRAYFRTPWSYRATVSRVSREMTGWRSVERILEELTRVLAVEMQLESVTVCLLDGQPPWSRNADGMLRRLDEVPALSALDGPADTTSDCLLVRDFLANAPQLGPFLASVNAKIILPLVFAGRYTGIVVLGPTQSRRQLRGDDLDLLRTLADQAAIAIENARSYEALEEHNRSLNETVRRRTAQLMQAEQLASLGQLVAGVAHELNNPVGAVYSSVENLRLTVEEIERLLEGYEEAVQADPEIRRRLMELRASLHADDTLGETRDLLAICSEGSERIRRIVRDLLTFARSDRGERVPVDLRVGLESTIRLLGDRFDRTGVRIVRAYSDIPEVTVNPPQINQVWMNLLTNALDALQEVARDGSEIRVALRPSSRSAGGAPGVVVEVADNGPGMSADVQARIFEPFFTTKEIGKGTGLGMSIAYGTVRDHGGTITVDATPGSGTVVRVFLPA